MTTRDSDSPTTGATPPFADALNRLRTRSGLSYRTIGRSAFVSSSTVHRYCSGAATPGDEDLVLRLGQVCGAGRQEVEELVHHWRDTSSSVPPDPRQHRAGRRWRTIAGLTAVAVVLVVSTAVLVVGLRSPHGAAASVTHCRAAASVYRADGVTGAYHHVWTHDLTCTTTPRVPVYADHSPQSRVVATMASSETWFVCWTMGDAGPGGNRLWFYTQGDYSRPDQRQRHAWGFLPADRVRGHPTQPPHDLEPCPRPAATSAPSA